MPLRKSNLYDLKTEFFFVLPVKITDGHEKNFVVKFVFLEWRLSYLSAGPIVNFIFYC